MPDNVEMKKYILRKIDGSYQKITVPAAWKVTFGPIVPNRMRPVGTGGGYPAPTTRPRANVALRFYESKEHQRAIFTDVVEFRDASIEIENLQENSFEIPQTERESRERAMRYPLGVSPQLTTGMSVRVGTLEEAEEYLAPAPVE